MPVNLVPSPFIAATNAGNRLTHSVDLKEPHLLGIMVPEKAFSQRPVPGLIDPLVPVDVSRTAPDLDGVLSQLTAQAGSPTMN